VEEQNKITIGSSNHHTNVSRVSYLIKVTPATVNFQQRENASCPLLSYESNPTVVPVAVTTSPGNITVTVPVAIVTSNA